LVLAAGLALGLVPAATVELGLDLETALVVSPRSTAALVPRPGLAHQSAAGRVPALASADRPETDLVSAAASGPASRLDLAFSGQASRVLLVGS
jgi:hypothetical protein